MTPARRRILASSFVPVISTWIIRAHGKEESEAAPKKRFSFARFQNWYKNAAQRVVRRRSARRQREAYAAWRDGSLNTKRSWLRLELQVPLDELPKLFAVLVSHVHELDAITFRPDIADYRSEMNLAQP